MLEMLQPIDFSILYWIQSNVVHDVFNPLMIFVSTLGNAGIIWIILGAAMLPFRRFRVCGLAVLIGLLCGLLIGNLWLKPWVARPRPCWIDDSVQMLIAVPHDYSFPSGHTLSACIAAVTTWLYHKRLGAVTLILAALMAFSRLYLFVHFPSDVLAGALLGIAIALLLKKEFAYLSAKWQGRQRRAE